MTYTAPSTKTLDRDHPLMVAQRELENEAIGRGTERYYAALEKSGEQNMPAGMLLIKRTVLPLAEAIKKWVEEARAGLALSKSSVSSFLQQFQMDDYQGCAWLVASSVIAMADSKHENTMQATAIELASRLEDMLNFDALRKADPRIYKILQQKISLQLKADRRHVVLHVYQKKAQVAEIRWGKQEKVRLGTVMLNLMEGLGIIQCVKLIKSGTNTPVVVQLTPEIDALIDVLFEAKDAAKAAEGSDAGRTGTLKHRMNFNENYTHVMDDGSTLRFSDLLENDSRIIVDKYVNSMAGHIAAAEHMGVYSPADFAKQIREAEELHLKEGALKSDASKFNNAKTLVEDAYATLIGRPKSIQSFSKTDRALNAMRAITRSTMLGQLGIPALFEAKNAIANTSLRAFALHSPEFTGILNSLRAGHTPTNQLVQDIQQFIGLGLETKAGYARQNSITEVTYDKKLTKFENFANDASHFTNRISGNGVITDATEVLSSMMEVQKHADWATGKVPITESQRLRMVGQGVSYDDLDDVLAQLKNHTEFHESGAVKSIDYEKWKETSPQTHDAYQTMLTREVSDVIQRAFEGEKWAWAGTPLGKIFTELKSFMLVGHAKQFLKNVHYQDATTHKMWTIGIIGAALEYSLAQSINYAHDPKKLQERLSMQNIALGATARMGVLGLVPTGLETGYYFGSGGHTLFKSGTGNTDNRNAFITPSMTQALHMATGVKLVGSAMNPWSTSTATKQEVSDGMKCSSHDLT